jgi:hypothetical protein
MRAAKTFSPRLNGYFRATALQMDDPLKGAGPRQGIAKSDGFNVS